MEIVFPSLPKYEFAWRSVQVEPIPYSGERITLGVILRGNDDALIVINLVPQSKLKSVFGKSFGSRIYEAYRICARHAESFYTKKSLFDVWAPPLEGFLLGEAEESAASNIEEALSRAAKKCSSLSVSSDLAEAEKESSFVIDLKGWRNEILNEVRVLREHFTDCFDRPIPLRGSGIPQRFGFISATYAAHFGSVTGISAQRQQSLIQAQSKLWQLDQLRDTRQLFQQNRYELILRKSDHGGQGKTLVEELIDELRFEAEKRDIGLYTTSTAAEAAKHIIDCAA